MDKGTLFAMTQLLRRLDSGLGVPGAGSETLRAAKAMRLARRDINGNTKITRRGRQFLSAVTED